MNNTHTWSQKSPFGVLIISASAKGVSHIQLRGGKRAHAAKPAAKPPPELRAISASFERYFAGDARALDGVRVDLSDVRSEFRRSVLTTLRKLVGPGSTISYGELAAAVGRPGAARAVGTAMATNPVPLVLPCHRVLASDGTLGGYGGGLDMKRHLLGIEGVQVAKKRGR